METFDRDYFKKAMKKLENNQAEMSRKTGINPATISKWYTTGQKPSLDCLLILSDVYGVSIDSLVNPEYAESSGQTASASEICKMILAIEKITGATVTGSYADNWNEIEKGIDTAPREHGKLTIEMKAHYDESLESVIDDDFHYSASLERMKIEVIKFFSTIKHLEKAPNFSPILTEDIKRSLLNEMDAKSNEGQQSDD